VFACVCHGVTFIFIHKLDDRSGNRNGISAGYKLEQNTDCTYRINTRINWGFLRKKSKEVFVTFSCTIWHVTGIGSHNKDTSKFATLRANVWSEVH